LLLYASSAFSVGNGACTDIYRVAVNESEPLYFRSDRTDSFSGLTQDVLRELEIRTGCKFEPVVFNRSKVYAEMQAFRVDLVLVTIRNPIYDKVAEFLPIATTMREVLISRSQLRAHKSFTSVINDPKIRFIVLPGVSFLFLATESHQLEKEGRFLTTTSLQSAYDLLARSNIYAAVQPEFVHNYFISKKKLGDEFVRIPDPLSTFEIGAYYVSKKDHPMKSIFQVKTAFKKMTADGTWKKLIDKYSH